jgi:V-type H+-transporting ATPase subunit d
LNLYQFEADRRVINITINSFNTDLSKDGRAKLYPSVGKLFPDGVGKLARCDDYDQVKSVIEQYPVLILCNQGISRIF